MNSLRSLTAAAILVVGTATTCAAQQLSPWSVFSSLTAEQLAGTQVRFTYVGPRFSSVASEAFTTTGHALDLSLFIPYYRLESGFSYDGDASIAAEYAVSTGEIKTMIDSVSTLPAVTAGNADSAGILSFGLFATVNGQPQCFEAVVDSAVGTDLVTKVLHGLAANASAVDGVSSFACRLGLLEGAPPEFVDEVTDVSLSGFRKIRGTTEFAGRLRLRNTSASALSVPLAAAVEFMDDVQLLSPTGRTCFVNPSGVGYVRFPASSPVPPGGTIEVVIRVANPGLQPIKMRTVRAFVDTGGH